MTDRQLEYQSMYGTASLMCRADIRINEILVELLAGLWLSMSKDERKPFLAPSCLHDREGPINKDFTGVSKQMRDRAKLRSGNRRGGVHTDDAGDPSHENAVRVMEG